MTSTMMEGLYAGMTQEEFERTRKLDCCIAKEVGWINLDRFDVLWFNKRLTDKDGALRDEPNGVPYFHANIKEAWWLMQYALTQWRYAGKQLFLTKLQQEASFSEQEDVAYPDVLISLAPRMHEHICNAFINTVDWARNNNFDLSRSADAEKFTDDKVNMEYITETNEETGLETLKAKMSVSGKPPWVH